MPTPRLTITELPEQTEVDMANNLIVDDAGTTKKMTVETLIGDLGSEALDAHIADTVDAHAATAISAADSGNGVDGTTVQAQLGQLASGLGAAGGGEGDFIVSDTPPEDTDALWADTTADGTAFVTSQTVNVFPYTDETDPRPDATVVFWIPDPWDLPNPLDADPGDLVLRTTPEVVQGLNGITGLWQGTSTEYDALDTYDATTVYFVINP
jgi:hypothetical protein